MRTRTRKNVFETNSSSVHSIVIHKHPDSLAIPESLVFRPGEFGWEVDALDTPEEKASYLYTAMYCTEMDENRIDFIERTLMENNCTPEFAPINPKDFPYIDHSEDLLEFLDGVMSSEESLLSYLFDNKSVVFTYNDNMDYDDLWFKGRIDECRESDDFEVIRKGN